MNNSGVAQKLSAKYPGPENGVTGRASARSVAIGQSWRLINDGHGFESRLRCPYSQFAAFGQDQETK